jgi:hypothetical protein
MTTTETYKLRAVLQGHTSDVSSVADPDPGSGAFLTPGFGIRDG